jgi:hypothetical protein
LAKIRVDGRLLEAVPTSWHFCSLNEVRFHWLLNADRGWYGWNTPQTYKSSGIDVDDATGMGAKHPGKTVAYSGLFSRRGYIRILP